MADLPVRKAEPAELRRILNELRLWERSQAGEILTRVASRRPPHRSSGQPPGTESQMVHYFRLHDLQRIAVVHQFVRPDGSIGGSGRPDPKRLMLETEIIYC